MLAREPNGHHQNQRRCPDHHAQRGEGKADAILPERIHRHHYNLAQFGAVSHSPEPL